MLIDISRYPKAKVLAALYNNSRPLGLGYLQYKPGLMTEKEAEGLLRKTTYFDYLYGRVMKVDLSGNEFDPWLYDHDNGNGAAQRAIASIKI